MVRVSAEFLQQNPEAHIQRGTHREALKPGWHFGSRYPGNPTKSCVYDSLPPVLLDRVENLSEFLGVLAFDRWVGNADARQAVFFHPNTRSWPHESDESSVRIGFVAQMVDNGHIFEGADWRFSDSPMQSLYSSRTVYSSVRGLSSFEPWLNLIVNFREDVIDEALKEVPGSWLEGDEGEIERLLEKLMRRRKRVPELIEASFSAESNLFPNWEISRHKKVIDLQVKISSAPRWTTGAICAPPTKIVDLWSRSQDPIDAIGDGGQVMIGSPITVAPFQRREHKARKKNSQRLSTHECCEREELPGVSVKAVAEARVARVPDLVRRILIAPKTNASPRGSQVAGSGTARMSNAPKPLSVGEVGGPVYVKDVGFTHPIRSAEAIRTKLES
jgi:hypothetical protein